MECPYNIHSIAHAGARLGWVSFGAARGLTWTSSIALNTHIGVHVCYYAYLIRWLIL